MFTLSAGETAIVNLLEVSKICTRLADENDQQYYDVYAFFENGDYFKIARFDNHVDLKDYFKKLTKDLNDVYRAKYGIKGRAKFGGKLNPKFGGKEDGTVQDNTD